MDLGLLALLLMADKECGNSDGSGCLIGCVTTVIGFLVLIVILWRMGAL